MKPLIVRRKLKALAPPPTPAPTAAPAPRPKPALRPPPPELAAEHARVMEVFNMPLPEVRFRGEPVETDRDIRRMVVWAMVCAGQVVHGAEVYLRESEVHWEDATPWRRTGQRQRAHTRTIEGIGMSRPMEMVTQTSLEIEFCRIHNGSIEVSLVPEYEHVRVEAPFARTPAPAPRPAHASLGNIDVRNLHQSTDCYEGDPIDCRIVEDTHVTQRSGIELHRVHASQVTMGTWVIIEEPVAADSFLWRYDCIRRAERYMTERAAGQGLRAYQHGDFVPGARMTVQRIQYLRHVYKRSGTDGNEVERVLDAEDTVIIPIHPFRRF